MTSQTNIAQTLAKFTAELTWEDVPADVRIRAAHHILDSVGIAMAAAKQGFAQRTFNAISTLSGTGSVGIIGMPASLPPRDAAIMNGFLCHSLDFDDTHQGGIVHPTSSAFPAALSAAMMSGASGKQLLLAYIIGIEASARISAVAKGAFHEVGFHPTGVAAAFSSALVAGKLLGLTANEMANAQGLALSMASGSMEFLEDGAWNKRMHPGWAANVGITTAALAQQGFNGATDPYEGRFGLYNTYLGELSKDCDLSLATAGLGETWELLATAIKPFPACHFTHAPIDAALILRPDIGGLDNIKSIIAKMPEGTIKVVCEPEANKQSPANSYDAQFSVPYAIAAALVKNNFSLAELEDDVITDPQILAIARLVKYQVDPDSTFPRYYTGEVVIETKDGRTLSHREEINRGAAERPLTNQEIIEKFRTNAAIATTSEQFSAVEQLVLSIPFLETADPISQGLRR